MITTRSFWLGAVLLIMGTIFAGGCANTKLQDENEKLRAQNEEAQSDLNKTRSALDKAEAERMARESEIARLNAELNARSRAAAAPPTAPTAPVAPAGGGKASKPATDPNALKGDDTIDVIPGKGKITVRIPGDVLFDSGKADLKSSSKAALDRIATVLKRDYAGKHIRIDGFTDTDPIKHSKWASNQALSEARAAAVKEYLAKKGVSVKIDIVGHGAAEPRETKAKSRRVEIVVFTD